MDEVLLHPRTEENELQQAGFTGNQDELIPLLQFYQKQYGYISPENVQQIAEFIKGTEAQIYGVASFYSQFRFTQPGEITIRICLGTACHVQGGEQLSQEIQKIIGIAPGEISPDHRYDFQEVACLGCCAQASVVEINGKIYGKMTPEKLRGVLKKHAEF